MICNEVDDELYAIRMERIAHVLEISHRSKVLIGSEVIVGVVTMIARVSVDVSVGLIIQNYCVVVAIWSGDPNRGDAHILKVGDVLLDALPIAALIKLHIIAAAVKKCGVEAGRLVIGRVAVVKAIRQ